MTNDPRNIFVNQRMGDSTNTAQQQKEEQPHNTGYNDMSVEDKKKVLSELASKYQKEGEGQLVRDIVANVIDQKAKGLLTNEQLQEFARRVTPLLNAEQKERLGGLLQQLIEL